MRQLTRAHIEAYKTHLLSALAHTGRPLAKPTLRNTLINLRCFFTRIAEWGYADAWLERLERLRAVANDEEALWRSDDLGTIPREGLCRCAAEPMSRTGPFGEAVHFRHLPLDVGFSHYA